MRTYLLLFLSSLCSLQFISAQAPLERAKHVSWKQSANRNKLEKPGIINSENCNNGLDDNGDGLVDMKDPVCYFSNTDPDTCTPTKILWASFSYRLYWLDLETGSDKILDFPLGEWYDDVAWTPNGKLYGIERFTGDLREIDPVTAQTQLISDIPGYYYSNGMTADQEGMLYLASFTSSSQGYVIKLNPATGQVTVITDLTALGLTSAGDLTFMEGYLYVSCNFSKLAKIDLRNGNVQIITYSGPGTTNAYGMVNMGDGYLYISSTDEIFRLDPSTWTTSFFMRFPTYGFVSGLCSYAEYCHSSLCKGQVNISVQGNPPFCSDKGVILKANGSGINGPSAFTWTLPDSSTRIGDSITAFQSGKFYLRYHTIPDTCGKTDSIDLDITQLPAITLPADTIICQGSILSLQPSDTVGITSYLWQDGSILPHLQINQQGLYWVEGTNACGTKRDSVMVKPDSIPKVDVGTDLMICESTSVLLRNNFFIVGASYLWSTGASTESITVFAPGNYWLQVTNKCGIAKDSIIIKRKNNDCECFAYLPSAFTPNNDGKNDIYRVLSICNMRGELKIYNRWGELVYFTTNLLQNGWNGYYKGVTQASDVYVYYLSYSFENRPEILNKKGTFVLIR